MSPTRILIVEDEPHWQEFVAELLTDEGYVCRVADTYEAALATLNKESFSVVFLDMMLSKFDLPVRDGTGWKLDWAPEKPRGDHDPDRIGNHGYLLDPTYIPIWSEETYSGGELEPYAWHNWRSYLSDRHLGESIAIFVDGHGARVDPYVAYKDNRMWNGLGLDPGTDESHPLYLLDPHVEYKWDEGSGQEWRYPTSEDNEQEP